MTTVATDPIKAYAAQFARRTSDSKGLEPGWLTSLRRRAFEAFQRQGFPTSRDEEWRFTSVATIAHTEFLSSGNGREGVDPKLGASVLPQAAAELVFLNGHYAPGLSRNPRLPVGVHVENLASVVRSHAERLEPYWGRFAGVERQAFVALNTALATDGAWVSLSARTVLEQPIHLIFVSVGEEHPSVTFPRVLVVAGAHSQASIVESYLSADHGSAYFTNAVTEVTVAEGATIDHYKLQRESEASYHIATIQASVGAHASFNAHSIGFGGSLVRNDVVVALAGEGGSSALNGLYMADAARVVDNHTTIDHATPHGSSREIYKGILSGRARAVFNGKIVVRPDAQKTDAKQTNKALLLSEEAQINTKPQLEIFANDVKCTHGAAVGQMDEDALFYLRARGLPLRDARGLLIHAFAGDVLNKMPLAPIRFAAEAELLSRLARTGVLQ